MSTLSGPFEVTTKIEALFHESEAVMLNRSLVSKVFSGDVVGIGGTLAISNVDGVHSYILDYKLA